MKNKKSQFTEQLVQRIEGTIIENNDAIAVLESRNVPDAWHYLDPPYPGADQGHYKGYGFAEYENLLSKCEQLKGKFLLSNYNSEMLDHFVNKNGWWKREFIVNNKGMRKNNRNKVEVLIANYTPIGVQEFDFIK